MRLGKIEAKDLRDTAALVGIWERLAATPGSGFTKSHDDRALIVAFANRALDEGDNPTAMFVTFLKEPATHRFHPDDRHRETAKQRLRAFDQSRRTGNGPVEQFVAALPATPAIVQQRGPHDLSN